ncbi:MAG: hypothetical protein J5494_04475, partial [Candidatus Methanomethylophilaceae archaeon]|nr:hypothetical protein [Candidatus Methanomethylophilaceae archaeon]
MESLDSVVAYLGREDACRDDGCLIVLEGIDGSGKSSQYRRLCTRMERDKIAYHHIVFPRYDRDSSALIR